MKRSIESLDGLAFVDIETTGLDAAKEDIVEVGVCFVEKGSIIARRSWLLRPSKPMPGIITALTGLTDDDVRAAPLLDHKRSEIESALHGWTLVAHNAEFERSFLGPLLGRAPVIDSCEVMHLLFPELPSHALDSLVRWAQVAEGARHRALEDAEDTFLVLREAFERVDLQGRRCDVERLVSRLSPAHGIDAIALVQLLARLAEGCAPAGSRPARPAAIVHHLVDESLTNHLLATLAEGRPLRALDIERPCLDELLEAARRHGHGSGQCVTVALPQRLLKGLPNAVVMPREQVCSTRLKQLVESLATSDEARLSRAWLEVWAHRSAEGDLATHSGWMAERHPETKWLLQLARGCTCTDPTCFVRRTERAAERAPLAAVSHELALDWLERGAPFTLLAAHAEQLPEAERRRTSVTLSAKRLRALARLLAVLRPDHALLEPLRHSARWLEQALIVPAFTLDLPTRAQRTWLDTRDLLLGLQKDLLRSRSEQVEPWRLPLVELTDDVARLLQLPGAGSEVRLGDGALQSRSTHAPKQILGRIRGKTVLVSQHRGGTQWAQLTASWVPPVVTPWSIETLGQPVDADALARLTRALCADALVTLFTARAPDSLASALERAQVPFRLLASARSLRGRGVALARWPAEAIPPGCSHVVLFDLPAWRAAVVHCGSRHVTLASPSGVPDEVAAQLADMVGEWGVRRLIHGSISTPT